MNLKNKLIYTAILMTPAFAVKAQDKFTIDGQLDKSKQGVVILQYINKGKIVQDTAAMENGIFKFAGDIDRPSYANVFTLPTLKGVDLKNIENKANLDMQLFYLDAAKVSIKGKESLKNTVVKGGKTQKDFIQYSVPFDALNAENKRLIEKHTALKAANDDAGVIEVNKEFKALSEKVAQINSDFIQAHPDSYLAFDMWKKKYDGIIEADIAKQFNSFSKEIKQSLEGKHFADGIALAQKLSVGQTAPDFTLNDVSGTPLSLSSLKGKNVLLCFWYKNFMPFEVFAFNLARINRQLKDKNFVILGVFYGAEREWKSTLTNNSMNWLNVIDPDGMDQTGALSTTAKEYGLAYTLLPQAYLVGTDGKILARRLLLKDTQLSSKIEKLIQ